MISGRRPVPLLILGLLLWSGSATTSMAQPAADDVSDVELRQRVRTAIQLGVDFLLRQQVKQNRVGYWQARTELFKDSTAGLSGLAVLALIHCDTDLKTPEIRRGLNYLRRVPLTKLQTGTYEASLILMALCAAEQPDVDRARIQLIAQVLQDSQVTSGPNSGLWHYGLEIPDATPSRGTPDRSNGQFAILALRDAAHRGAEVSSEVWQRAHEHWTGGLNADGGWGYHPPVTGGRTHTPSRGSMTAAGLSTVAITSRMLQNDADTDANGIVDSCAVQTPPEALARGRHWLGARNTFSVQHNPRHANWRMYYLYGLERAARLTGVRFMGNYDWYRSGAAQLVQEQHADGSWTGKAGGHEQDPILATSMALLFLSKGLSRIVINKLDYNSTMDQEIADGDWNRHYRDIPNLMERIDSLKGWPPRLNSQVLTLNKLQSDTAVSDLNQAPILYLSGREAPQLSDEQISWLREYIDTGGFIYAQQNCGDGTFDQGIRYLVTRLFPEGDAELKELRADHPVFRSEYILEDLGNITLYGVDFGCRTSIIYSPEDHGAYWQKWTPHPPRDRSLPLNTRIERSIRLGVNIVAYATGREPPEKLHEKMTPRDKALEQAERGLLEIAQLRHEGGWDTAPRAVRNLLEGYSRATGVGVSRRRRPVRITREELDRFPLAYMHGRFGFRLQPDERRALRDYLHTGTILLADACCGSRHFDRSFRTLMEQLFPDHPLKRIPVDHAMYQPDPGFDVRHVRRRRLLPSQGAAAMQLQIESGPPELEGVQVDGQYVVIYSRYDLSCALENQASLACDGYVEDDAMKLAVNAVLFSMHQAITVGHPAAPDP